MASSLVCWYCSEHQPLVGHDNNFNLICDQCLAEVPANQVNALTILQAVELEDPEVTKRAYSEYEAQYSVFITQRDKLLDFYDRTKDLPWRLVPGSRSGPTWSQHYQASLKSITLVQDQFDLIKSYLDLGLSTQAYPQYDLSLPGKVVKVKPTTDQPVVSVVITDHYFTTISKVVNNLLNQPDQTLRVKIMVEGFSCNANLTLEWLLKRPNWPWDWHKLNQNPNFNITWVEAFPDKAWDFDEICTAESFQQDWLSRHPSFSLLHYLNLGRLGDYCHVYSHRLTLANIETLLLTVNQPELSSYTLCRYIDLNQTSPDLVLKFLQDRQLVNLEGLCGNVKFHWAWLLHSIFDLDDDLWSNLSHNRSINATILEKIYQHSLDTGSKTRWDLALLSHNPAFQVTWLQQPWFDTSVNISDKSWQWSGISRSASLSLDLICAQPSWPWDVTGLGCNPNFQPHWVATLAQYGLIITDLDGNNLAKFSLDQLTRPDFLAGNSKWNHLSYRSDLTWDFIREREILPHLNWTLLCQNANLVWSDDPLWTENRDKWDFLRLSANPNLDWTRFKQYLEEAWDLAALCRNSMILL